MRRLVIACAVLLTLAATSWAAEKMPPVLARGPEMLEGENLLFFGGGRLPTALLSDRTPITGFAFGPGRLEVAYCGVTGEAGRCGLWVVGAGPSDVERERIKTEGLMQAPFSSDKRQYRTPSSPPRLLWTAPEGVTLRGPIWWSPNGTQLAARAFAGEKCELVSVDYVSGEMVKLAEGDIAAVAWSPDSRSVAFVKTGKVWLQTFPPGEAQALGEGGLDLRWSVDGKTLQWIAPQAGETWLKKTWESGASEPETAGRVPARPESTVWSPDGRFCAVITEAGELTVSPSGSAVGETIAVEGVRPQRMLGWTPDSRMVVVLAEGKVPVAVAAQPESALREDLRVLLARQGPAYRNIRASVIGPPMNPEAGPPSWSANLEMLAYVYDLSKAGAYGFIHWQWPKMPDSELKGLLEQTQAGPAPKAAQGLIAVSVIRQAIPRNLVEKTKEMARVADVRAGVQQIAYALESYANDFGVFPEALTGEELREALRGYLENDAAFRLPESEEVVVQYLVPPGTTLGDVRDPGRTPTVVVEALPDWDIVGFADGHVMVYAKTTPPEVWRQRVLPWRK